MAFHGVRILAKIKQTQWLRRWHEKKLRRWMRVKFGKCAVPAFDTADTYHSGLNSRFDGVELASSLSLG